MDASPAGGSSESIVNKSASADKPLGDGSSVGSLKKHVILKTIGKLGLKSVIITKHAGNTIEIPTKNCTLLQCSQNSTGSPAVTEANRKFFLPKKTMKPLGFKVVSIDMANRKCCPKKAPAITDKPVITPNANDGDVPLILNKVVPKILQRSKSVGCDNTFAHKTYRAKNMNNCIVASKIQNLAQYTVEKMGGSEKEMVKHAPSIVDISHKNHTTIVHPTVPTSKLVLQASPVLTMAPEAFPASPWVLEATPTLEMGPGPSAASHPIVSASPACEIEPVAYNATKIVQDDTPASNESVLVASPSSHVVVVWCTTAGTVVEASQQSTTLNTIKDISTKESYTLANTKLKRKRKQQFPESKTSLAASIDFEQNVSNPPRNILSMRTRSSSTNKVQTKRAQKRPRKLNKEIPMGELNTVQVPAIMKSKRRRKQEFSKSKTSPVLSADLEPNAPDAASNVSTTTTSSSAEDMVTEEAPRSPQKLIKRRKTCLAIEGIDSGEASDEFASEPMSKEAIYEIIFGHSHSKSTKDNALQNDEGEGAVKKQELHKQPATNLLDNLFIILTKDTKDIETEKPASVAEPAGDIQECISVEKLAAIMSSVEIHEATVMPKPTTSATAEIGEEILIPKPNMPSVQMDETTVMPNLTLASVTAGIGEAILIPKPTIVTIPSVQIDEAKVIPKSIMASAKNLEPTMAPVLEDEPKLTMLHTNKLAPNVPSVHIEEPTIMTKPALVSTKNLALLMDQRMVMPKPAIAPAKKCVPNILSGHADETKLILGAAKLMPPLHGSQNLQAASLLKLQHIKAVKIKKRELKKQHKRSVLNVNKKNTVAVKSVVEKVRKSGNKVVQIHRTNDHVEQAIKETMDKCVPFAPKLESSAQIVEGSELSDLSDLEKLVNVSVVPTCKLEKAVSFCSGIPEPNKKVKKAPAMPKILRSETGTVPMHQVVPNMHHLGTKIREAHVSENNAKSLDEDVSSPVDVENLEEPEIMPIEIEESIGDLQPPQIKEEASTVISPKKTSVGKIMCYEEMTGSIETVIPKCGVDAEIVVAKLEKLGKTGAMAILPGSFDTLVPECRVNDEIVVPNHGKSAKIVAMPILETRLGAKVTGKIIAVPEGAKIISPIPKNMIKTVGVRVIQKGKTKTTFLTNTGQTCDTVAPKVNEAKQRSVQTDTDDLHTRYETVETQTECLPEIEPVFAREHLVAPSPFSSLGEQIDPNFYDTLLQNWEDEHNSSSNVLTGINANFGKGPCIEEIFVKPSHEVANFESLAAGSSFCAQKARLPAYSEKKLNYAKGDKSGGWNTVHDGVPQADAKKVQFFVDLKTCIIANTLGNLPLHTAAMENNLGRVKRHCIVLRIRQISVNTPNADGLTALQLAVLHEADVDIIDYLLESGANMTITDSHGNNVVHLAVIRSQEQMLYSLLPWAANAQFNFDTHNFEGFTPLILSIINSNYAIADTLLKYGASPNSRDHKSGRTALFHAVEANSLTLVKLLLWYTADTKIRNYFGTSPHDAMFELDNIDEGIRTAILGSKFYQNKEKKKGQQLDDIKSRPPKEKKKLQVNRTLQKVNIGQVNKCKESKEKKT